MQLENTARNAMSNAFAGLFGNASRVRFRTSANAEVATLNLNATPFAAAVNGKIVANAISPDGSADGGVVAHAVMLDNGANVQATLSVGTASGDIIMTTLNIAAGSTVSMSSLEFTMPAS